MVKQLRNVILLLIISCLCLLDSVANAQGEVTYFDIGMYEEDHPLCEPHDLPVVLNDLCYKCCKEYDQQGVVGIIDVSPLGPSASFEIPSKCCEHCDKGEVKTQNLGGPIYNTDPEVTTQSLGDIIKILGTITDFIGEDDYKPKKGIKAVKSQAKTLIKLKRWHKRNKITDEEYLMLTGQLMRIKIE